MCIDLPWLVLSATFWLPVLMRGVGALVALAGPSAKVAHANIQKNPRRVPPPVPHCLSA